MGHNCFLIGECGNAIGSALKWVLNDENVCTAIPGVTSFDQLDQNTKLLADVSMTDQEKLELKAQSATAEGCHFMAVTLGAQPLNASGRNVKIS